MSTTLSMAAALAASLLTAPLAGGEGPSAEDHAREADMFGSPAESTPSTGTTTPVESTPPVAAATPAPAETVAELAPVDQETLISRLLETNDKLAIGARFFLRTQYNGVENPEVLLEDNLLSSPSLLDVYFDGRPNDRLRAYARGRLSYDPSIARGTKDLAGNEVPRIRADLDQLWLKFDVFQTVFFTIGKQRIKWGAGRFWNPTDFVNQQRLDPLAVIDERLGATIVKAHLPIESLGWNFYAIADLQDAAKAGSVGGALRAEFLLGNTELTFSAAARNKNPLRLGMDLSTGIGPIDLRAELAVVHPHATGMVVRYEGELDPAMPVMPIAKDRKGDWIPQAVLGAETAIKYSDEDSVTFGAEYFFNDTGYADASLYPYLLLTGAFQPLYTGRHYAGAYAALMSPGSWNDTAFTLSALGNLSDRSFLTRLDFRLTLLTNLSLNAYSTFHFGGNGEFHYALDIPKIPSIPQLENGFHSDAPLFEVGAGLMLNL